MYTAISVEQVLNTPEELQSFPVEGTVNVLFNGKPDLSNVDDHIYIVRHDDDMDVNLPNLADTAIREVGTVDVDRYDKIISTVRLVETEVGVSWTASITPTEALIPNASYYLILSKYLKPDFYLVEKTSSIGPSSVIVETGGLATSSDTVWVITITSDSLLTQGSNTIGFSVTKDGSSYESGITIDLHKDSYTLSEEVELVFDKDVPFLTSEEFTITTNAFTALGETLIQDLNTNINSDIIPPSNGISSERLNNADIVKFYEDNGWARRTTGDNPSTVSTGEISIKSETHRLDTVIIDCGVEIDPSTIIDTIFNIDIDYAFGNYMLDNMGYYDKEVQYAIYYSIVDKNFIKLVIEPNTDLVPSGSRYKLLPGV